MRFRLQGLTELKQVVKELAVGLRNLTFGDNFQSFELDLVIPASGTVSTRNQLTIQPSRYIIVSNDGDSSINRTTPWNESYISFKNNGSVEATVKIIVLR